MSIHVFTANDLHAAAKSANGKVFIIEKKKEDKAYKGTRFLNAYFNIGEKTKKEGWFSFENIELCAGVADPANDKDKRNEFEGLRLQLQTTVSRAGSFGAALMLMQPEWKKIIEELAKAGTIDMEGRRVHDLMQLTLSKNNKTNPGGKIEDPVISFKVDFDPFPQKYQHKFLVGQPRTQFFDARTKYVDAKGNEQYKPATVINDNGDEELVTEKNLHKFVTEGSKIIKGRVMMPSVPVSGSWVSLPIVANKIVLLPGVGSGFSDEGASSDVNAVKTALISSTTDSSSDKSEVTNAVTTSPVESETADVENLLDNL